jgi:hypothetical protein
MKKLLQIEEAGMFAACLYLYPYFDLSWWWFTALILTPDFGMIGYLVNNKAGAYLYNVFHHRGLAALIVVAGLASGVLVLQFIGYILFTHACMDRMLGYGLKYEKGFRYTHLGEVGKEAVA